MEFDASTAEPVTAAVEPQFDAESATPIAAPETPKINRPTPAEGIPIQADYAARKQAKEERGVTTANLGEPAFNIPQLPEISATPDHPLTPIEKVASVGAGVYNEGAKVVSSFTSPANVAILLSTGGLAKAAQAGSIAARRALVGIGAYFGGTMAKDAIEQIPEAAKVVQDPNASLQEKTSAVAAPAMTATMSILAGLGAVHEIRPDLQGILRDKAPAEAAKIVREEANKTEVPAEKIALENAADQIATGVKEGDAAKSTFDPSTAEPLKPVTREEINAADQKLKDEFAARNEPQATEGPTTGDLAGYAKFGGFEIQPVGDGVWDIRIPGDETPKVYTREQLQNAGWAVDKLPEATPEVKKAGPEKIADIKTALADPDTVPQLSVWPRDAVPEGKSRLLQVDFPSPNARGAAGDGNYSSASPALLREMGVDIPEPPEWLPPGSYSIDQIREAIKAGPPKELAEVGLGAASPAEFRPVEEFQTSLKNSVVDQERAARGQPPAMKEAAKDLGTTWTEAMRRIDEDQNVADTLIEDLKNKRRAITDVETAILLHRKIDLENQFDRATRNVNENIGTPDSLAADRATQQRVLDELLDLETVGREAGTETGRGLNARKLMAAEDFTLSKMLTKRRVARGGAKLTPEEIAEVEKQHREIEEAQRALDEHEAQQELDAAITTPEEARQEITKLETESKEGSVLEQRKKRIQKRIDELREKIKKGDFAKRERVKPHMDHEANVLQAKLEEAKGDFNAALEKDKYDRLSSIQKLRVKAADVYDAARNLMTTGEFSFVLRQGKLAAASHPIMTARALPKAFQALFADETTAHAIDLETFNHPDAADAQAAGLHLVEEGARLTAREEALASTLADKLPVLRNFNQAGRVFLNKLRFDLYETMNRPGFGSEQRKAIAQYANEATGRGSLGSLERAAVPLARVLFAPRYLASRLQYAVGHSLWGGDLATRRIIATEYARTLVGLGVYYASLQAAFNALADKKEKKPTITFDPRSSDFGKIKMGNTRLDPLAGLAQVIVFAARTASGEKTNTKGVVVPLRGKVPYGGQKWSDVAATFARSKLHPIPGAIINLFDGTDLAGNKVTPLSQAENMIAPLTYLDVYQALEEQDLPQGVALSLLALLGEGLQTYNNQKPKKQMGQPPAMLKK